jgi:hypothetical protein
MVDTDGERRQFEPQDLARVMEVKEMLVKISQTSEWVSLEHNWRFETNIMKLIEQTELDYERKWGDDPVGVYVPMHENPYRGYQAALNRDWTKHMEAQDLIQAIRKRMDKCRRLVIVVETVLKQQQKKKEAEEEAELPPAKRAIELITC